MIIREESHNDCSALRILLEISFAGTGEADLVERLRRDGDAVIALVAVEKGRVVGQVMFSRMRAPFRALGLGPLAVDPHWRRQGFAARLIEDGIARAKAGGWEGIFVLGDPNYYGRFGFAAERAAGFQSPYAGPYLMALALQKDRLPRQTGKIDYAPAFAGLG